VHASVSKIRAVRRDFELMIIEEASGAPIYKPRLEFVLSPGVLTPTPESVIKTSDAQKGAGVFK
jgi:hypothetical protein